MLSAFAHEYVKDVRMNLELGRFEVLQQIEALSGLLSPSYQLTVEYGFVR